MKLRGIIISITIIVVVLLSNINSCYASNNSFFSEQEAYSFIGFIYNTNAEDIKNTIDKENNCIFRLLTGQLSGEEAELAKIVLINTVYENVNKNIDEQGNLLDISESHLLEYLNKKAGSMKNLDEEIVQGEINTVFNKLHTYLQKSILTDIFCCMEEDVILGISAYNEIKSLGGKVQEYIDNTKAAINAATYIASGSRINMYKYFKIYIQERPVGLEYLQDILDANYMELSKSVIIADPILNWTSKDNISVLHEWAEYIYQTKESLKKSYSQYKYCDLGITSNNTVSVPDIDENVFSISQDEATFLPNYAIIDGQLLNIYNPQKSEFMLRLSQDAYGLDDDSWSKTLIENRFSNLKYIYKNYTDEQNQSPDVFSPCSIMGVKKIDVQDTSKYVVVIAFKGTGAGDTADFLTDVNPLNKNGIRSGFYDYAEDFYLNAENITFEIDGINITLRDIFDEAKKENSNYSLIIGGHSLGAAVADVLTGYFLYNDGILPQNCEAYTYATPKSSSTYTYTGNNIFNIINIDDPVPNALAGYSYIGKSIVYTPDENLRLSYYGNKYVEGKTSEYYNSLLQLISRDWPQHSCDVVYPVVLQNIHSNLTNYVANSTESITASKIEFVKNSVNIIETLSTDNITFNGRTKILNDIVMDSGCNINVNGIATLSGNLDTKGNVNIHNNGKLLVGKDLLQCNVSSWFFNNSSSITTVSEGGVLIVNGNHTVKRIGDINDSKSILTINGFEHIKGNLINQGNTNVWGGYYSDAYVNGFILVDGNFSNNCGNLYMTNPSSYIKVFGNLTFTSSSSNLAAGTIEVNGNISGIKYTNGTSTVKLTGVSRQAISGDFNNLIISNTSSEGVAFETTNLYGYINNNYLANLTDSINLYLCNNAYITSEKWSDDISFNNWCLTNKNLEVLGLANVSGTLNLVNSKLITNGDIKVIDVILDNSTFNLTGTISQTYTTPEHPNRATKSVQLLNGSILNVVGNYQAKSGCRCDIEFVINKGCQVNIWGNFLGQDFDSIWGYPDSSVFRLYNYGILSIGGSFRSSYMGGNGIYEFKGNLSSVNLDNAVLNGTGNQKISNCTFTQLTISNTAAPIQFSNTAISKLILKEGASYTGTANISLVLDQHDIYIIKTTENKAELFGVTELPSDGTLYIPDLVNGYKLTAIAASAFSDNSSIKRVYIPKSIEKIGDRAFYNCSNLENIEVEDSNEYYYTLDGVLFSSSNVLICFPANYTLSEYEIPDGTQSIDRSAFAYTTKLTKLTFPSSITNLSGNRYSNYGGRSNFTTCKLKEVVFKEGLISLDDGVFATCRYLKKVTLPMGLETIGNEVFYNCTSLTDISFPETVTKFGYNSLKNTAWYNNQPDEFVCINNQLIGYKGNEEYVEIPNNIESIAGGAFYANSTVKRIKFPDTIKNIGIRGFYGCSNISNIVLPKNIEKIEEHAFYNCSSLKKFVISGEIPTIASNIISTDTTVYYSNENDINSNLWSNYVKKNIEDEAILLPQYTIQSDEIEIILEMYSFFDKLTEATIVVALYNDNELLNCYTYNVSVGALKNNSFDIPFKYSIGNASIIKIFAFNNLTNIKPLSEFEVHQLQ